MSTPDPSPRAQGQGAGLAFAITAYGLWGFLPGFFLLLDPASPWEIVAFRVLMSLGFCAVLLTVTRGWRAFVGLARQWRVLGTMALAGLFIYINWQVFVLATLSGHVVEGSLGYFINPIVTVALGVIVLRERLRPLQWAAVGISLIAILVISIGYGAFPWIALILALSFGFYGFIKKRVGAQVDAISGLTLETAWLTPVAIVQLIITGATVGLSFGDAGPVHIVLMIATGVITATPLLLFAAAARRLPLVALGLTQFLAPVLQFLTGVFLLGEPMPAGRWAGFGLVWIALVILVVDMVRAAREGRRASLPAA
ncbi:EamA family transporter RarD [Protaetiibacter sp. SSC-01]|uniref:EamA family transporter RarD n=1 Tax=Protaetiibacter sp. SSC-01 TaxID=2759943 RepID=UPI00165712C2|nr:EamA family transporter RarD [Protaetiibacter sp. SSC-01]QNO37845.1 EamA family transporter RarD [Protaetiibacter sp. SSC-01]